MKPLSLSGRAWFAALALLTVASLTGHAESFAVGDKPATANRIDFKVDLQPQDPFSDANKVGAPRAFMRGEVLRLVIEGAPRTGFHSYPLTKQYKDEAGNISTIKYAKNADVQPLWPVTETPPESINEEGDGLYLEHRKPFTWTQDFYIRPEAKPGARHIAFTLPHFQVCDKSTCKFGEYEFDVPFTIIDAPVVGLTPSLEERLKVTKPPVEMVTPPPLREVAKAPAEVIVPTPNVVMKSNAPNGLWDLLGFMLKAMGAGAISLLTPCVFPMIPITVSYFLKQSEKSSSRGLAGEAVVRKGRSPILLAGVYSATIATVLTISGVLLIPIVQPFSTHWATNLVLGGLFVLFALSLFGMYDIVLPSGLGRLTASGEGRGGLIGVVFMALTFTVISFACVAPFYGGFIALSASASSAADWLKLVLGALAFSVTFALPFFVLALFPSLLKALPKSGSWLNTVKVVMGFLELAAAFKFLRASELNFFKGHTEFLTYDLVLGVCIALSVACGLYLLGLYRLPHDHGAHDSLSVPRLMFSIAFLGLALYMLPGLFTASNGEQQRPGGTLFAWIDAFLLPEDSGPVVNPIGAPASDRLAWVGDLNDALIQGEADKKLVFLDFTATTCTNCKFNERNVFIKPEVKDLLRRYVLVHLYTDNVPPEYHSTMTGAQYHDLQAQFGNDQLPLYVIVRPTDKGRYEVVGRPYDEGKINNIAGFTQFLHDPLAGPGVDARAEVMGK
jgi:thiol:disulfide interchange protein